MHFHKQAKIFTARVARNMSHEITIIRTVAVFSFVFFKNEGFSVLNCFSIYLETPVKMNLVVRYH